MDCIREEKVFTVRDLSCGENPEEKRKGKG